MNYTDLVQLKNKMLSEIPIKNQLGIVLNIYISEESLPKLKPPVIDAQTGNFVILFEGKYSNKNDLIKQELDNTGIYLYKHNDNLMGIEFSTQSKYSKFKIKINEKKQFELEKIQKIASLNKISLDDTINIGKLSFFSEVAPLAQKELQLK